MFRYRFSQTKSRTRNISKQILVKNLTCLYSAYCPNKAYYSCIILFRHLKICDSSQLYYSSGGKMNSAAELNITFWFLDLPSKSWLQKSALVFSLVKNILEVSLGWRPCNIQLGLWWNDSWGQSNSERWGNYINLITFIKSLKSYNSQFPPKMDISTLYFPNKLLRLLNLKKTVIII